MSGELSVARDFSRFPAGRYVSDGKYSGEKFREMIVERLRTGAALRVILDGTMGYGSSFLEEAFGGLVRQSGFSASQLRKQMSLESSDMSLVREIWSYVDRAKPKRT